jgi:hypothetical protein
MKIKIGYNKSLKMCATENRNETKKTTYMGFILSFKNKAVSSALNNIVSNKGAVTIANMASEELRKVDPTLIPYKLQ